MMSPYNLTNHYCLRTPLLSFTYIQKILSKEPISDDDFFFLLKNKVFTEALFIASPELYKQIKRWKNGLLVDPHKIERLKLSILKYATRIATRCTPFGLFAACNIGSFNSETNVALDSLKRYTRITRFDMTFLSFLINKLLKDKTIRQKTLFYPNTSLYKIGGHYRYVEYSLEKDKRTYAIEGFNDADYVEKILEFAKKGATISELGSLLIDDETTIEDAELFINELIENQILVSELELKVTGTDFLSDLIQKLPTSSKIQGELKMLQLALANLDRKFGNSIEEYTTIIEKAKAIIPTLNPTYLLQTDSFSNFKRNSLAFKTKKQLKKACRIFNKITLPIENVNLENFKIKFKKRYEEKEMPLHLVLDIESGIGYGKGQHSNNYLLDDIPFQKTKKQLQRIAWTAFDKLLFDKYTAAIAKNQYSIILTNQDLSDFPENWNDLPDTFSGIAEVYLNGNRNKVFINGISGSSATNLLGRFGYGGEQLMTHLNEIVQIENELNPAKILAEIVHLPQSRTGNVLQRPTIRAYEIPYLGNASVSNAKQIPSNDILISIKNNNVVLRSKKLNKEILPRLANAHNFNYQSLPLYQFLCDVQTDTLRGSLGFRWNIIFLDALFLPRVEYEDLIFSKARWNLNVSTLKNLMNHKNTSKKILEWRTQLQIPQYIELVEGDNRLLINMNNCTSIEMLLNAIKKKHQFIIEEFLFNKQTVVNRNDESFCNQFVVSFYNEAKLKEVRNG